MKKILMIGLVLCLVGCGSKEVKETAFSLIVSNMNSLNSYKLVTNVNMEINENDVKQVVTNVIDTNVDVKNKLGFYNSKAIIDKIPTTSIGYFQEINNQTTNYSQEDNVWYKSQTSTNGMFKFNDLSSAKQITKDKYEANVTKEILTNLLANIMEIDLNKVALKDVKLYIYTNNDYIDKIELNVPSLDKVMNLKIDYSFSLQNKIEKIIIPTEVINNSLDAKILEYKVYAIMYVDIVRFNVMPTKEATGIYTNADLKYDGIKPSKVKLELKEGEVVTGIIEFNDYQVTIANNKVTKLELK
ncbi:MAG: hypothetical protein RSB71_01335 [Bacilli bacterium]